MSAKDSIAGNAKRLVAEIVGDGKLAEEGSRQAAGSLAGSREAGDAAFPAPGPAQPPGEPATHWATSSGEDNRFAALLGRAAVSVWADLPRDAQERLFAAATDDGVIANDLAEFLHDRHPRTAHPPKPTRLA